MSQNLSLLMMLLYMPLPVRVLRQLRCLIICCCGGLWGLTVSLVKSKGMVVGTGADVSLLSSIPVGDGFIDFVEDFQYLRSCISSDGELDKKVPGV